MSDKYAPAAMWGLYNSVGYLCRADYRRENLMRYGSDLWGVPWRTVRRRGEMTIRRVYIVPFVNVLEVGE